MGTTLVCLQCGTTAAGTGARVCRRCGLRLGDEPRATASLPTCPVCYRTVGDDGRLPALDGGGTRRDLVAHLDEHEAYPVGDDEWLETLRVGDRITVGRWSAPFDLVRRYLVTGSVEAGRGRVVQHNAVVTAMTQIQRWGREPSIFGDQPEWVEARAAVSALLDRYHRVATASGARAASGVGAGPGAGGRGFGVLAGLGGRFGDRPSA